MACVRTEDKNSFPFSAAQKTPRYIYIYLPGRQIVYYVRKSIFEYRMRLSSVKRKQNEIQRTTLNYNWQALTIYLDPTTYMYNMALHKGAIKYLFTQELISMFDRL